MFDKKKRRFEALLLAAVTVIASFSVNWSSLSPRAEGGTFAIETGQDFIQTISSTAAEGSYTDISAATVKVNLHEQESVTLTSEVYVGSNLDPYSLSSDSLVSGAGTTVTVKNDAEAPVAADNEETPDYQYSEITSSSLLSKTISLANGESAAIKVTVNSIDSANSDETVDFSGTGSGDGVVYGGTKDSMSSMDFTTSERTPSTDPDNPTDPDTPTDSTYEVKILDSDTYINLAKYNGDAQSRTINASISPAVDRTITLTPANTGIVSSNGLTLTAVSSGSTLVTASAPDAKSAVLTANVIDISCTGATASYDRRPHEPTITLKLGGTTLTKGTDYTVTYVSADGNGYSSTAAPSAKGTYNAVITGLQSSFNYSDLSYTIPNALTIGTLSINDSNFTNAVISVNTDTDTVTAVSGATDSNGNPLTFGQDFTVKSVEQLNTYFAGYLYYNITFEGAGNYSGTATVSNYKVETNSANLLDISKRFSLRLTNGNTNDEYTNTAYTGNAVSVTPIFINKAGNVATLPDGAVTYTWSDPNGNNESVGLINAGTYTLTATGNAAAGYTGTLTAKFTINTREIFDTTVTGNGGTKNVLYDMNKKQFVYTGNDITPEITNVRFYANAFSNDAQAPSAPTATLTPGTDYDIIPDRNSGEAGNHYATIQAKGNYSGTVKVPYTVVGSLENAIITVGGNATVATKTNGYVSGYSVQYDGTAHNPDIKVNLDGIPLTNNVDYTLSYDAASNTNASATVDGVVNYAKIVLSGLGTYAGQSVTVNYTITPKPLDSDALTMSTASKVYTGSEISLTSADFSVKDGSKVLKEGTDFTLNYITADHTNVGTVSVAAEGIGNYSGTTSAKNFDITPLDAAKTTITLSQSAYEYDGTAKEPAVTVTYNGITLSENDYTVSYQNNTDVGNASAVITGKNNLTGTNSKAFTISKRSIQGLTYSIEGIPVTPNSPADTTFITDYEATYKGSSIRPVVTIMNGSTTLRSGKDYTASYINNTNAATKNAGDKAPAVLISGKGNYSGSNLVFYFTINPKNIDSEDVTGKFSNGKVTLKDKKTRKNLTDGTDYTITTYDASKETPVTTIPTTANEYELIAAGKGNYTGTKTISYDIGTNLKNAKISFWGKNDTDKGGVFEYMAGNAPYITATLNGEDLTGPTYVNGAFDNSSKTSDFLVSFGTEDMNAGSVLHITLTANPNSTKYFGSCDKMYDEYGKAFDAKYTVTERDISRISSSEIKYTDSNAKKGSAGDGTQKNPFIYSLNDTGSVTPNISATYKPEFDSSKVGEGVTTKSETISNFTVTTDNAADTTAIDVSTPKSGLGSIRVSGQGNYKGTVTLYYKVEKASASDLTVTGLSDITYDGESHDSIKPTVKIGSKVLTEGTDYTLSYPDSEYVSVGTHHITITAASSGIFEGSVTKDFKINKADLSTLGAISQIANQAYTGAEINLQATASSTMVLPSVNYFRVTRNDKSTDNILTPIAGNAVPGSANTVVGDYYYTYSRPSSSSDTNHSYPGAVVLTVHGNGNYTGTVSRTFYIQADISDSTLFTVNGLTGTNANDRQNLSLNSDGTLKDSYGNEFSLDSVNITYTDTESNEDRALSKDAYNVKVSGGDINTPGLKTVTLTGKSPLAKGTRTFYVKVTADANDAVVSVSSGNGVTVTKQDNTYILDYTGSELKPPVSVYFRGNRLKSGTDYTVEYMNTTEVGSGTIKVTGQGGSLSADEINIPVKVMYNLNKAVMTFDPNTYAYTGYEITPVPTVKINETVLNAGTDYDATIKYTNNVSAGTAYAAISADPNGERSYGTKSSSFKISAVELTDSNVKIDTTATDEFTGVYNGSEQKPAVSVEYAGQPLTEGTDYTLKYSDNTNAGTAKITVKGIGGYTGTVEKTFTIAQKKISDLADTDITIAEAHYAGGDSVEPNIVVKDGSVTLVKGKDYTIGSEALNNSGWANNTNVSTDSSKASVTIFGLGNYDPTSSKTVYFDILPTDLSSSVVKLDKTETEYTGNTITPSVSVTVTNGSKTTELDSKYYEVTVQGTDSIKDAGSYTCVVEPKSGVKEFTGSKTFTFNVNKKEINYFDDSWSATDDKDDTVKDSFALYYKDSDGKWQKFEKDSYPGFTYDAAVNKSIPEIYLIDTSSDVPGRAGISDGNISEQGVKLTEGTDYKITYVNNGLAASAESEEAPTVKIEGTGNYSGTIERKYSIGTDISDDLKVTLSDKVFYYDGTKKVPTVVSVKFKGRTLTEGTDYTVSYPENAVEAGTYNVEITGKGAYYGTYKAPYEIRGKRLKASQINVVYIDNTLKQSGTGYYTYYDEDGEKIEPAVEVYDGSVSTKDSEYGQKIPSDQYDVTYGDSTHDNVSGGTKGSVHVVLKNDYSGSTTKYFDIKKIDISDFELNFTGEIDGDDKEGYTADYTGSPVTSDFYIMGSEPDDSTIYSVDSTDSDASTKIDYAFTNNTNVGDAELTITGKGNYTGSIKRTINIQGNLEDDTMTKVTVSPASYTGEEVDPEVTVTFGDNTLIEGTDYTAKFSTDDGWRTGTVDITGTGHYYGTVSADYKLTFDGSIFTMSIPHDEYPYTGSEIKPPVTITNSGTGKVVTPKSLTYESDSDGEALIKPGTVTITAVVTLADTDVTLTKEYKIVAGDISDCEITGIDDYYDYTGSEIKPASKDSIEVTLNGLPIPDEYFAITYPDTGYVKPGAYTVRIVGKGNYSGYKDAHYQIRIPKVENLKSTNAGKNSATLTWDKVRVATGYRVTYTVNGKQKTIKTKNNYISLTGLPESSLITVNVSAYRRIGKSNYYSVVTPIQVGTALSTPTITAGQAKTGANTITWKGVTTAGGYMIYRATSKNGTYRAIASVPSNRTSFADKSAKSGRTYYYKLSTFRIDSNGAPYDETAKSDAVNVKTK